MRAPPSASGFSLQNRLLWGLGLAIAVGWLVAVAGAGLLVRHEIDEVFDSAMQEVVQRVLPLAYSDILAREADDTVEQRLPDVGKHEEYITYVVRDGSGRVLLQSHDAEPALFPPGEVTGFRNWNGSRFYTESAVSGSIVVTAMERPGHRASTVRQSVVVLSLPLLLLLPGMIGATIWLVSRSVRPVAAFGAVIASRGEGNLAPIAAAGLPSEIHPVERAVNLLLERLRRTLEAERSLTANAAHELRTPVAGALAQTQRLIADLDHPAHRARAADIEAALLRLARLTEKLLQLAKAEGGNLRSAAEHDLRTIFPLVLADLPGAGRIECVLPEQPILSNVDIDIFAIALRNLVENALKHGPSGEPIRVLLGDDGALSVVNGGPPIATEEFQRLCQRFERGATRAEGAGLGLAIISAIAKGLGGTLTPATTDRGQGVEIRLAFPLR
ncbi:MAG: HAMP domain-containing sensor histidine kinase [Beijerinckiaceae bacterium]|nr:HAMP domain-containing sensor histidine kinase [Beijerinckiaceae bacterium]MCZ8300430.1 HAMP domain-containing sensor histidine kinase [Beijerinckiaceae bacterium]